MSMVGWKKVEVSKTGPKGARRPGTTLAAVESLAVPLVQEVVFLADFRCPICQHRVAEIMSKMNGETESVVISVVEKTVTLTRSYPNPDKQIAHASSSTKVSVIVRLLRSYCN
ncbi:hypothetical protein ABFS83_12G079100 [Erythranthe nasuta]